MCTLSFIRAGTVVGCMVLQKHHRKLEMTRREHLVLPYLADAVDEVPSDLRKKKQDLISLLTFLMVIYKDAKASSLCHLDQDSVSCCVSHLSWKRVRFLIFY